MEQLMGCLMSKSINYNAILKGKEELKTIDHISNATLYASEEGYSSNDVTIWFKGNFKNISELKHEFNLIGEKQIFNILEIYQRDLLQPFLNRANGLFSLVIYDKNKTEISFITDRLGMKPIYIYFHDNCLIWALNIKSFYQFNNFKKSIKRSSIDCFITLGHLMGNETWFENLFLVGPSQVKTFSITNKMLLPEKVYWKWSDIVPNQLPIEQLVSKLNIVLQEIFQELLQTTNPSLLLALSGGLDSRCLLAYLLDHKSQLTTFTFGEQKSQDVIIASQVAKKYDLTHFNFELTQENWLNKRVESIYDSDCAANIIHFHAKQFSSEILEKGNTVVNGFSGDLILGGSWTESNDQRISTNEAKNKFGEFSKFDDLKAPFYNINKEDPYSINNRVRRFTTSGLSEFGNANWFLPFIDNRLIELAYSISDSVRIDKGFYKTFLLQTFPGLFKTIPKQGTGLTIDKNRSFLYYLLRSQVILKNKFNGVKVDFANYDQWLTGDFHKLKKILTQENSISSELYNLRIPDNLDKDNISYFSRSLTAEIYFQQIFENRYLTTEETFS